MPTCSQTFFASFVLTCLQDMAADFLPGDVSSVAPSKKRKLNSNGAGWWKSILTGAKKPKLKETHALLCHDEARFATPDIPGIKVLLQTKDCALWCIPNFCLRELSDFEGLPLIERPPIKTYSGMGYAHRDVSYFGVQKLKSYMLSAADELHDTKEKTTHSIYESARQVMPSRSQDLGKDACRAYHSVLNVIEKIFGVMSPALDGCYINYYRDGSDCIGAHSDKEVEPNTPVVSIAFGATRTFRIRDKTTNAIVLDVAHVPGMLLVMDGAFQAHYKHEVPAQKKIFEPRLSITLRQHFKRFDCQD